MADMLTVREAVRRAKEEGLPVAEYSLRHWLKTGSIPCRNIGNKALLYYPNLVRFLQCADGADNTPAASNVVTGIRRVEL